MNRDELLTRVHQAARDLYQQEQFTKPPLLPAPGEHDTQSYAQAMDTAELFVRKLTNPKTPLAFYSAMRESVDVFLDALPITSGDGLSFPMPIVDAMPNIGQLVETMVAPFLGDDIDEIGLYQPLRQRLTHNLEQAGNKPPSQFKGTPRELVDTYLGGTALRDLFELNI